MGQTHADEREAWGRSRPHFLGAIVIQQIPTTAKEIDQRNVIDGQQRVTTLQLLLDAIQWICEGSEYPYLNKTAKRLAKFVVNDQELFEGNHIFKLRPTKSDEDAFRHAMDNGLATDNFSESPIVKAHEFFQRQITAWLEYGKEPIENRIDALVETTTAMLQIVVIDLDGQDDPNIIFETLNARGTPLEQSDLIKNFVFSLSRDSKSDIWENLNDKWWKKEISQGRLYRPRLDMIFNYWLMMRKGAEVPPSKVFDEFRKHVNKQDIQQVMSEIRQDFAAYRMFEESQGRNPTEKSFHRHMTIMQAGVITPVLLLLLSDKAGTHTRALDALESFLIRRMICRDTTKDYNRMMLELASQLRNTNPNKASATIIEFLREQEADSRKWPSDEEIEHHLGQSPLYNLLTRGRLRLVLEGIERQLRSSGKTEQYDFGEKLSIEHRMPVGWRSAGAQNWPLPDGISEDRRDTLINSIGNLTLVTQKLNSAMSNSPWKHKRGELGKHSILLLNKELPLSWAEKDITARSRRMARLVSERWPGPNSKKWNDADIPVPNSGR